MEEPIKVKILDDEYLIKSDESEQQVMQIAEFVNEKLREVRDNIKGISSEKIALLAAFYIAGEYFQILKEHDTTVKSVQNRTKELIFQIDSLNID